MLEVSPRDYHKRLLCNRKNIFAEDSWMSKSLLWQSSKMSLSQWRNSPPEYNSDAIKWGTLLDCLITTPDEFDDIARVRPDTYDAKSSAKKDAEIIQKPWNANSNMCKSWLKDNSGYQIISESQNRDLLTAAKVMMNHPIAGEIIENSMTQVVLLSEISGIRFKGLLDLVNPDSDYLVDIKTTNLWGYKHFQNTIGKFGYHVQAGIYLHLWNKLNPDKPKSRFRHIWQQQSIPYELAVTELPLVDINKGQEYASFLLDRLKTATRDNKWSNIVEDKIVMCGASNHVLFSHDEEMEGLMEAPKDLSREESLA